MNIDELKNKYISDKTLVRVNLDDDCKSLSNQIWPKIIYASNSWPIINGIHAEGVISNCNMKCQQNNPCHICKNAIYMYLFSKNTEDLKVGTLTYRITQDQVNLGSILYDIYINSSWIPPNYTCIDSKDVDLNKSFDTSNIYDNDMIYKDMAQLIKHVHQLTNEVKKLTYRHT